MAWVSTINIKGSKGASGDAGADGVRWFSAAGIPTEEPGITAVATAHSNSRNETRTHAFIAASQPVSTCRPTLINSRTRCHRLRLVRQFDSAHTSTRARRDS